MISTAGSICGAADVCLRFGAREVYLAATHGVFCGPAIERIAKSRIREIVVTNSLALDDGGRLPNLQTVSIAPMLGEAIRRIHRNESVSVLFD
jgi:ribose-phosphate pyrophosphokinase